EVNIHPCLLSVEEFRLFVVNVLLQCSGTLGIQPVLLPDLQQCGDLATPDVIILKSRQVIGGVLEGTAQGLTPATNFKHPSCLTGLVGWGIRAYAGVLIDSEPLAHQGVETMLIPDIAIDEFLSLMRVRSRRHVCFELLKSIMKSPDVDTILAYHPKTLA